MAFIVRRAPALGNNPGEPGWMEVDAEGVKAWVAARVTDYKHIAEVRFVDVIPKAASGKILRRLLRDQLTSAPAKKEAK